jgi:threonine/homoserine/homoserine lactone efflux protein
MFPVILLLFLKSMVLGLGVSAPLGPNGMLMVNRTIRKGFLSGFVTGMGVATADTIFAIIAALGFSFVIGFINTQEFYIKLFAGIIVAVIGLKLFLSNPIKDIRRKREEHTTHVQDYFSVLLLALTNPFSILVFLTFLPGFNIDFAQPGLFKVVIILGVFLGASAWWFGMSYAVTHFSRNLRLRSIVTLNKISGSIIIFIGVVVLITLLVSAIAG